MSAIIYRISNIYIALNRLAKCQSFYKSLLTRQLPCWCIHRQQIFFERHPTFSKFENGGCEWRIDSDFRTFWTVGRCVFSLRTVANVLALDEMIIIIKLPCWFCPSFKNTKWDIFISENFSFSKLYSI